MFCKLETLPRNFKRMIMVVADLIVLPLALWMAIALRRSTLTPVVAHLWWVFPLAPLVALPIFLRLGLYRAVIRYMEDKAFAVILLGVTLSAIFLKQLIALLGVHEITYQSFGIYWMLALLSVTGTRVAARAYFRSHIHNKQSCVRVAIYGAGETGVQLASALRSGKDYHPVAFFDDKSEQHNTEIYGIKVYPLRALPAMITKLDIMTVFLALPSASRSRRREIINRLELLNVQVRTVPTVSELVSGALHVDDIREVDIEDVLGRDPVSPDESLLGACITGKSVLVSGAGGSIGTELCRQILLQDPVRLVLYELSEFALYQIDQELRGLNQKNGRHVEIVPILGSVCQRSRVETVIRSFKIDTVYHAAAYKHVPLVEYNAAEGVRNNVFGTLHLAQAAMVAGVETFVLISTDKAVRPANVMGASKRLAELILQGLDGHGVRTRFSMVRFGNVLGSSGSVVPLFRKQIHAGGPVTLTHPDVIRYFMTIPEAAQLVLQAGSMGVGGDVFVLDMGQPVKIIDLAKLMIHLSGLTIKDEENPEGDIEIKITGLRPGEKLYEELLIGGNVEGTQHSLIMRAVEARLPWERVEALLDDLADACDRNDCARIRALLVENVQGYVPRDALDATVSFEVLRTRELAAEDRPKYRPWAAIKNAAVTPTQGAGAVFLVADSAASPALDADDSDVAPSSELPRQVHTATGVDQHLG